MAIEFIQLELLAIKLYEHDPNRDPADFEWCQLPNAIKAGYRERAAAIVDRNYTKAYPDAHG